MGRGLWFMPRAAAAAVAVVLLALAWGFGRPTHDEGPQVRALVSAPLSATAAASQPPAIVSAAAPGRLVVAQASHRLLRVGSSPRGGRDIAVMRIHGGPPTQYAVGDTVSPGMRLRRILATHVELE